MSFPNPRGLLSNRISSAAIESANHEVHVALNKELPESASVQQFHHGINVSLRNLW